jgi:hypothetical protein
LPSGTKYNHFAFLAPFFFYLIKNQGLPPLLYSLFVHLGSCWLCSRFILPNLGVRLLLAVQRSRKLALIMFVFVFNFFLKSARSFNFASLQINGDGILNAQRQN